VDMAQVVTGRVGRVFGEFLAESEIGRTMQTSHKALDHGLGDQFEARDACENRRIETALHHQAPAGGGICSIRRRRISSDSMRSDSAWKFSRIRWRRTGMAS